MHDRQITRNNFVDKEKNEILSANTSQNSALVYMRFLAPLISLIFCHLLQCRRIHSF